MTDVSDLITEGLIERVPVDVETAGMWLDAAQRHLVAAQRVIDVDPEGAYSLQYDAARKAVAAIMLSEGLRARAMPGSHRAVAEFARRIDATSPARKHLRRFDAMRRNRNRIEYGATTIGSQVVADDLQHAREIVVIARRRVDRTSA